MVRSDSGKPIAPLLRALDRSGIGGLPVEIWLAIANAMAPDGVRYRIEDVEELCGTRPDIVSRHRTPDGFRYQRAMPPETGEASRPVPEVPPPEAARSGPFTVEDEIAIA